MSYRADWVIGADADEFFWPRGGSLAEVLAAVPRRFGTVRAPWRFFLARPDGDEDFAERMTVRLSPRAWLAHPLSPYKPDVKIAHRGVGDIVVQGGNHRLLSDGLEPAPWHPIEVLHFPIRSVAQLERKMAHWSRAGRKWSSTRTRVSDAGGWFDSVAVSDDVVAVGIGRGDLVLDTRLRDLLRQLRQEQITENERGFRLPAESTSVPLVPGSGYDESSYRAALAGLQDRSLHQLQRRLDELAARVGEIEPARPAEKLG